MTPPRHPSKTPPPSLTDTGEREAIADEVEARIERKRERTLGPVERSDSSEHIRAIARDEATRTATTLIQQYQRECVKEGPICGVWEEIGKMRDANTARDKQISEFIGAQKLARWFVPIIVSLASSALVVGMLKILWKAHP